jgi:hypothetical protein
MTHFAICILLCGAILVMLRHILARAPRAAAHARSFSAAADAAPEKLEKTALYDLHLQLGGKVRPWQPLHDTRPNAAASAHRPTPTFTPPADGSLRGLRAACAVP